MLARIALAALIAAAAAVADYTSQVTITTRETAALTTSEAVAGTPGNFGFKVLTLQPRFVKVLSFDTDGSQFINVALARSGSCIVYFDANQIGAPVAYIWSATNITCTFTNLAVTNGPTSFDSNSAYTLEVKKAAGYSCAWNSGIPGCPSTYETPVKAGLFRPASINQGVALSSACSYLTSRKTALINAIAPLTWTSESDSGAAYVQLSFSGAFDLVNVLAAVRKSAYFVATELPINAVLNNNAFLVSGNAAVQSIVSRSNPSFSTSLGYLMRDGGVVSMFSYKSRYNPSEVHSFILARLATCNGAAGPQYYGFRVVKIET